MAYVGSVKPHKGAEVFAAVVAQLSPELPQVRFRAFGGGDPSLLAQLRRLGVAVRGYYRHGTLPHLLTRHGVDLVLLPSVVPESYGLAADECAAAGVPVLAFDLGALGERLPPESRLPLTAGASGMAARLRPILLGRSAPPPLGPTAGQTPREAAAAYGGLYLDLASSSCSLSDR